MLHEQGGYTVSQNTKKYRFYREITPVNRGK